MRILITGGCGFIGHHFVEHLLKNTDAEIVIFDKLSYASQGFDRLREIGAYENPRVKIMTLDFTKPISEGVKKEVGNVEIMAHLGAETHVDNSIVDPLSFVEANVLGTVNMLEFARSMCPEMFFYFSTDEVFGPAPEEKAYKEWDRYNSTNPYAATKAGAEELCLSYGNTYGVPVIITHTMNAYGERQHFEKFIPKVINCVLTGDSISIHANKQKTKAGSRFYIHARNIAAAMLFLIDKTKGNLAVRDKYNIVGELEVDNLKLAKMIAAIVGKPLYYEMVDFHSSRPGHDLRYALDGSKMREMGWKLPVSFEKSLEKTVKWYLDHPEWLGIKDATE